MLIVHGQDSGLNDSSSKRTATSSRGWLGTGGGQPKASSQGAEPQSWEVRQVTSKSSEEFPKGSATRPEEAGHCRQQLSTATESQGALETWAGQPPPSKLAILGTKDPDSKHPGRDDKNDYTGFRST